MNFVKGYFSWLKSNPGKVALTALIAVVFLGGTIAGLYNKARATIPGGDKLPAPK